MNIIGAGIDTVNIEIEGIHKLDNINNRAILKDKTTYTNTGNTRIVIRASEIINGGVLPTTLKETIKVILEIYQELEVETGTIFRIDFSADTKEHLKENKALFRLFLECLNIKIRKEKGDIFKTVKGIAEDGNIKIISKRVHVTIYNSSDKDRIGNTRIEIRFLDIRITSQVPLQVLETYLKKSLQELVGLEQLLEKVEVKYIENLYIHYTKTIGRNFRTFTEFVAWADYEGYILTIGILKGLLHKVGKKIPCKRFIQHLRRTRGHSLKFSTKTDLKKLIQNLKKELEKAGKINQKGTTTVLLF